MKKYGIACFDQIPWLKQYIDLCRFKETQKIKEENRAKLIKSLMPEAKYNRLLELSENLGIAIPELHYMLEKISFAGIQGAAAGKKLAEAMEKINGNNPTDES